MAQVKEFIAKVLKEIEAANERNLALDRTDKDMDVLLRYESELLSRLLESELEKRQNSDEEVSAESLQFCMDLLAKRYEIIKDTDAIYNHHPYSKANTACIILAKNLVEALPGQSQKHHYEYLFPGIKCADYVTSKGDLGNLELREFFWSDDHIPVETLKCLDDYRTRVAAGEDCFPYHVCLSQDTMSKRSNKQLSPLEVRRLLSHSEAAKHYSESIECKKPKRSAAELDTFRRALVDVLADENLQPQYTYNQKAGASNKNILRNNLMGAMEVNNFESLANILINLIKRKDWISFVSAIDTDVLYHILLPKKSEALGEGARIEPANQQAIRGMSSGGASARRITHMLIKPDKSVVPVIQIGATNKFLLPDMSEVTRNNDGTLTLTGPDDSVLRADKFDGFVKNQTYDKDSSSDFNKAVLFLLTELYMRKRAGEGHAFNGVLGAWSGIDKESKEIAADRLREFFTQKSRRKNNDRMQKTYMINEVKVFLADHDGTVHWKAINSDRLGSITKKASVLGPGIHESAGNIAKLAQALGGLPKDRWMSSIELVEDNVLRQLVDSAGGFVQCLNSQQFKKDDHDYNKAILFILTIHYIRNRSKGTGHKHTGLFGKMTAYLPDEVNDKISYAKDDKVKAAEYFRDFLCSDFPPNGLSAYLKRLNISPEDRDKYERVMRDRFALNSDLGSLVAKADAICTAEYYNPAPASGIWSTFGKYW